METVYAFLEGNRTLMSGVVALSSIFNVVGWCIGLVVLLFSWNRLKLVSLGPMGFRYDAAVAETAGAAREWNAKLGKGTVDIPRVRETIRRAFEAETSANLTGKNILWVDDNPPNNNLATRALIRLGVNLVTALSTEEAMERIAHHRFDMIISDMGRGSNMHAGYDLFELVRRTDGKVPFAIFSGEDRAEFRKEAARRGAQLSTNDILELINFIITRLGADARS